MSLIYLIFPLSLVSFTLCYDPQLKNTIMAHRGIWGYFPEHAIDGFITAYYMGADYLETDISVTKDGELVIFHDSYLDNVTNVANFKEYETRRRNDTVDGNPVLNKLFISDFTFKEVLGLFITQRFPYRPQTLNERYKVITLEELIIVTIDLNKRLNRTVGIYIEPKSPEFYNRVLGIDINQRIYDLFQKYGLHDRNTENFRYCPIVIQSFEFETIKFFKSVSNLPLIFLMRWTGQYNLTEVAKYADGIGPDLDFIYYERIDDLLFCDGYFYKNDEEFKEKVCMNKRQDPWEILGNKILSQTSNKFIEYVHNLGMVLHPWQMANDQHRISDDYILEYYKLIQLGVDGFFTDFCDSGIFAIKHYKNLIYNFDSNFIKSSNKNVNLK